MNKNPSTNKFNHRNWSIGQFLSITALAGACLLSPPTMKAALLAYEGFNYATGSANLTGLSGGFGWGGSWQGVNNGSSSVQASSLVAGGNAPAGYDARSAGNFAFTPNNTRTGRRVDVAAGGSFGLAGYLDGNSNIGADGTTIYLSFLQQPNGTDVYYEFEFHRDNLGDPGRIAGIGNDQGGNNVNLRAPNGTHTVIGPGNTGVNFYVVRIDFKAGNDDVFVYRNATSVTEPLTPTLVVSNAADMSFDGLSLGAFANGRTVAHDEVRVGETWADVVSPGFYSAGNWDGGGANNNWSTAGNWDNNVVPVFPTSLTFAGSTRLDNTNDLPGVSANSITFDSAAGAFTVSGNSLGLNGNISFNANPASLITQTINLPLTPSGNFLVDTHTNGNITINGDITGSGSELTQTSTGNAGVLTLGGNNSLKGMVVNGGTNRITGTTAINGLGGGSFFYLADAQANRTATLVIEADANLTVSGAFQDAAVFGRDGGVAAVIQNGGTFSFNINDGSHEFIFIGASGNPNTRSTYNMNGGVLDMNGKVLGIALGANTVITGVVNQVSGAINNVGELRFSPFFTQGYGIYNLSGGSISIGASGITAFPGSSYEINLGGGTVSSVTSWSSALNMNLTGVNGSVTFDPAGNIILLSGNLSGPGGLTVNGPGILELSGVHTYTGNTIVTAGSTLQYDVTGTSFGALRLANGSTLNLNYSGTRVAAAFYTNGVQLAVGTYNAGNLPGFITGTGDLQVTSGISAGIWDGGGANNNWSTGANWDQNSVPVFPIGLTFAGTTRLANNNDLVGITAGSITFDSAAGAFVLNGNDITASGSIGFNGNPAAPVTQTINLGMTWPGNQTIDTPINGNLILGGNITSGNALAKIGQGTLTLGGADVFSSGFFNNGTSILTGNLTVSGTGGGSRFLLADANTAFNSTLVIQPSATLTVNGNFGDAGVIGRDGGSGTVIQNGGTFTFSPGNQTYLFVGASGNSATRAVYQMNGGVLDMSGNTLGIALGAGVLVTGVVNQVSGAIDNVGNLLFSPFFTQGYGIYNLSGGSITIGVGGITVFAGGGYEVNLGGGTIAASASWSSSLNMNLTGNNGSVTFSPAGNIITLSGALSGTGGLTVSGFGTLELSGANTYAGDTTVGAGCTLQLDTTGTSPSTFRVANGALLNLNYTGNYVVAKFYTNGVALPVGVYSAGNLSGFITGTGSLEVKGIVFSTQPQSELVYLNGNYNQSVSFTSSVIGGTATFQWYLNGNVVPGATSSNLTLSNVQITNAGNYFVVATGTSGSVTSSVASLTVYGENNNVFVYDGFAYPGPTLIDGSQNGGSGWNGAWSPVDNANVNISLGNLVGGANVPAGYDSRSVSNCIEVLGFSRAGRLMDCSPTSELGKQGFVDGNGNLGANGKTVYIGFLQQPSTTSLYYEFEFHRGSLGDPGRIAGVGNDTGGNNVNLRAPNGVNNRSLGAGSTDVNFYIVRIDFKAGNDDVFVYRNPTSTTEPVAPTLTVSNVADMSFGGLSVGAFVGSTTVKHDEIRVGATWADAMGLAVSNLLPPTKTANGYTVQFACTPGNSYRIQRATVVTGPWTDLTTVTGPANAFVVYEDTNPPAGEAFYRTVTP
jgi:autotransporter-associated beta strand protein